MFLKCLPDFESNENHKILFNLFLTKEMKKIVLYIYKLQ